MEAARRGRLAAARTAHRKQETGRSEQQDISSRVYGLDSSRESDLSSGEHSSSESGSSVTSETGNKSSSNELTVRQLRRQRKCAKPQPNLQEGLENMTATGGGL
ncbi:hypothetical protein NDU88_000633 [Pleurodeles waltl]|uniref:Uncharacterized protein n=1 Tax=Pleurodeles waltl TaxID=8319 RepID=A0AAV7VVB3_PLEWA|nr:hypothetical protein NDU88_000633 [Pleurodeles waltl]